MKGTIMQFKKYYRKMIASTKKTNLKSFTYFLWFWSHSVPNFNILKSKSAQKGMAFF